MKAKERIAEALTAFYTNEEPLDEAGKKLLTPAIDEIAAMLPHRPYEEPMILPFGKNYVGPGIANMGAAVQVGKLELENN